MKMSEMQKAAFANKIAKGFNTTDVGKEFLYIYGEVSEAYEAWHIGKGNLADELADVAIYLLGLAEIVGVDLEKEIIKKMEKNKKRTYYVQDGVVTKTEG